MISPLVLGLILYAATKAGASRGLCPDNAKLLEYGRGPLRVPGSLPLLKKLCMPP